MTAQATCTGKEGLSWSEAERRARGMRRKVGARAVPFHCQHCGHAHIGNSAGGNVSRRRRLDRLAKIDRREMSRA